MHGFNFVLFYVEDPAASVAFYRTLLGRAPVDQSPTFAIFALDNGINLGLWSRRHVEPTANLAGGGGEIAFVSSNVDGVYSEWRAHGCKILQAPTQMDFGYTFVACDPDGHRLRVFNPEAQ